MSVQQEHATSETATLTTTESGGVYQSLFDKINLTPVSSIQEIDLWQNSETLADASPDERVTAAIHVLLSCLAKSGEDVVKLDKSLLDFHIDDLDQKISKQLDAVMHHPEFQKVESLWRGTWFVVQRTDFRKNVRIELIGLDWLALEIYSKYLILAKDILGIPLDTGQLSPLQNFVDEYNNKAGKLSTPLDKNETTF